MLRSFGCRAPICLTLILRLTERIAHRRKKFLVIERLHEKGDRANGHGGRAHGQIFSRGDDNNARPRTERAHPGENFETGHAFHPNVSHHHGHGMRGGMGQKFFRLIEPSYFQAVGRAAIWAAPSELRARFYQGLELLRHPPQSPQIGSGKQSSGK